MKYAYKFSLLTITSIVPLLFVQSSSAYGYGKSVGGVSRMVGEVSFLQLNDLKNTNYLSKYEKKYDVNIVLDSAPGLLLGFDLVNDNLAQDRVAGKWLELLRDALMYGYKVQIRYKSSSIYLKGKDPKHADVLSVAVSKPGQAP